ncbi:contact-dependent growth inhibition system immunity protein [Microbacterium sp. M1A1_1b]
MVGIGPARGRTVMKMDHMTERAVKQELPELWNLLNATFHADWRDDFESADSALAEALIGYSPPDLSRVHHEVSGLLAGHHTDEHFSRFFDVSGADLWVESELGISGRAFAELLHTLTSGPLDQDRPTVNPAMRGLGTMERPHGPHDSPEGMVD